MPVYDYRCKCGLFETVAGREDYSIACPQCGDTAERVPVYKSQGVAIKDGPNSTLPPPPKTDADHAEVNSLLAKEMKKRNYPTDRVYDDLRKSRTQMLTADGQSEHLAVDTKKLPKEV